MKLTVLTDNHAGGQFLAEHGLSFLIEHDDTTILLDAGSSDVFLTNALKLGIKLEEVVDQIVLSHGHWDHGNGLQFMQNKPLLTHPSACMERFRKTDNSPIGIEICSEFIKKHFEVTLSKTPVKISENIFYLGEIPRLNDFESKTTPFIDENGNDDFVPDDSALALIQNEELIIVSGCAHSGICNICEYAKEVTGINKIKTIIGGFHLKHNNSQTKETIKYFKKQGIEKLMPSHCTELPALAAFYFEFKINQIKTGQQIET